MSIKLYMDHHVDIAITEGLRRRGGRRVDLPGGWATTWDDDRLLDRATRVEASLFQDDDLLAIVHQWRRRNRSFAGLVYGHQLDLSIGQAVRDLELIAGVYDPEDTRDRVEYLPPECNLIGGDEANGSERDRLRSGIRESGWPHFI